jgi:hypothetical protein
LAEEAERVKADAKAMPHGRQRELLARKARQLETASHISEWLSSPGLKKPEGRAPRVTEYRAYTIGVDGHIAGCEPLVCATDADAVERAKRLLGFGTVELWTGPRLVTRLEQGASA